MFICLCYQRCS